MVRKSLLWLALGTLTLGLSASAMELEEVIDKHIEARGGMEALKNVETMVASGKMMMPGGVEMPFTIKFKRPNMIRAEFAFQGMEAVQAYDGESGWGIMPFMGKPDPEPLPDDMLKQLKDQADLDGPLVDSEDKGYQVELLGTEDVDGTEAYKIKITKANGDIIHSYLDTEHFLEFRQEARITMQGQEMDAINDLGDFKEVHGLIMPHSIESRMVGMEAGQTIVFDTVEVNSELDDAIFSMPEAPAEEAEAAE